MSFVAQEETIKKCLDNAYYQNDTVIIEKLEKVLAHVRHKNVVQKEKFNQESKTILKQEEIK